MTEASASTIDRNRSQHEIAREAAVAELAAVLYKTQQEDSTDQFQDLSDDQQAEYLAASDVLCDVLQGKFSQPISEQQALGRAVSKRSKAGHEIHEAWLSRHEQAHDGPLDAPFAELPDDEKAKIMEQYDVALELSENDWVVATRRDSPAGPGGMFERVSVFNKFGRIIAENVEGPWLGELGNDPLRSRLEPGLIGEDLGPQVAELRAADERQARKGKATRKVLGILKRK